ncbi:MAG: Maf family protein [Betaproteobacteria bacterium]|nr:Maf family protein [Betaproteobacteria bacterium]
MRIHLASRSPRRRDSRPDRRGLRHHDFSHRRAGRPGDRRDTVARRDPVAYVERVARAKADHGGRILDWRRLVRQPVLAADTTLEFAGSIIGKPNGPGDAEAILRRPVGTEPSRPHRRGPVPRGRTESGLSVSEVVFRPWTTTKSGTTSPAATPGQGRRLRHSGGRAGIFVRLSPAATPA